MRINGQQVIRGSIDDGSVDVNIQDQTSAPFHRYFMTDDKTDITLTIDASKDDYTLNVSSGHGFTATGEYMLINYGSYYQQSLVESVSANEITISTPIGIDLTTSGTQIIRGSIEMNVDGSTTPVTFYCRIGSLSTPVDIKHFHVFSQSAADNDDGTYCGITALTNGTFIRYENDVDQNLGLYRANSDFIEFGGIQNYTDRAPAGNYSADFSFDLVGVYGSIFRLYTSTDIVKVVVQDDLSGLIKHRVVATGQLTVGEE